jgi:uncharacterized membrane protein SpoIIM required for sporulation
LIFFRGKENFNKSIMNELSDEVHVYLDVFVALMLKWIFGEIDGTMIVTLERGQMMLLESKLRKHLLKPQGFLTCINYYSVVCFF